MPCPMALLGGPTEEPFELVDCTDGEQVNPEVELATWHITTSGRTFGYVPISTHAEFGQPVKTALRALPDRRNGCRAA